MARRFSICYAHGGLIGEAKTLKTVFAADGKYECNKL